MTTPTTPPEPSVQAGRSESSRRQRALPAVLAAVLVGMLSAGLSSPAMAADTCANAAVRAQAGSAALPDCRGYEMVSSSYKEGFQADPILVRFTDDGILSYGSAGTFAGNQLSSGFNRYHATRSAAGWLTRSISLPGDIYYMAINSVERESPDLRSSLWYVLDRLDMPGDEEGAGWYFRGPDGHATRVGDNKNAAGPLGVAGVSPDLSHVVYTQITSPLWEHVGTGNGPPRTVSVDNDGQVQDPVCFRQISPDGRVIVYSTECAGLLLGVPQVWARIGGSVSVMASGSECTRSAGDVGGLCNGVSAATYAGGSADGSRVFFTTRQQLVNDDTDTGSESNSFAGNDLYACDLPAGAPAPTGAANACATLTRVSGVAAEDARVESVVAVSDDGSRVYFVADGVLAGNLGVGEVVARPGVPNLYVWDRDGTSPAGTVRFVAGGLDTNGNGLMTNDLTRAQLTPDGRYLLFQTANQMVRFGPGADSDGQVDVYRYDAVTKAMVRVSVPVSGSGGNAGFDATMVFSGASSMTADGSTVIFDTAEALSVADTDGVTDVYSWSDDGGVSLISAGGAVSVGITPSGRDIFFSTRVPVLGADRDGLKDIYDARADGGFALAKAIPPCSGDACQGQRSQPPGLAGPSAPATGSRGLGGMPSAFSLRAVSLAQRRMLAATGKVSLTVTSNAPGTISARATATIGGRAVSAGSGRRVLAAAGKATVTLTLTTKARRQLAARGKLTVRISVSHSKVALDRSVTLRLARAKAKRPASRAHAQRAAADGGEGRS